MQAAPSASFRDILRPQLPLLVIMSACLAQPSFYVLAVRHVTPYRYRQPVSARRSERAT